MSGNTGSNDDFQMRRTTSEQLVPVPNDPAFAIRRTASSLASFDLPGRNNPPGAVDRHHTGHGAAGNGHVPPPDSNSTPMGQMPVVHLVLRQSRDAENWITAAEVPMVHTLSPRLVHRTRASTL
jgi:hypothetical protein